MKNFRSIQFIVVSLLIIVNSCKKDSKSLNQNENLLTQKGWTVLSIRQNLNSGGWVDLFSSLPTCKKDNEIFFKPDYTILYDQGATKCDSLDRQSFYYGTWWLTPDGKKLQTSPEQDVYSEVDVYLLNNSNLITLSTYISGTDTTIMEIKYIH